MHSTVESANNALDPAAIGRLLRRKRKLLDLTLEEAGRRCGMDPTQLSRLEKGGGDPSASTLSRAMGGLGLTLQDLANDSARDVTALTAPGWHRRRPTNAVDYAIEYEALDD